MWSSLLTASVNSPYLLIHELGNLRRHCCMINTNPVHNSDWIVMRFSETHAIKNTIQTNSVYTYHYINHNNPLSLAFQSSHMHIFVWGICPHCPLFWCLHVSLYSLQCILWSIGVSCKGNMLIPMWFILYNQLH